MMSQSQLQSLSLRVSEDQYAGDAQFVVLVDGVQIGNVQTATASHSAGQWQDLQLSGDFSGNPSEVSVKFLNDAWGGTAATDRNLYIASFTLNGQEYQGSSADNPTGGVASGGAATLNADGAITFAVGGTPSTATPIPQSVAFASNQYITLGDTLQYDNNQSWSVASEIKVDALPPGPSAGLPGGGASLVFGNTNGAPYQGYELWLDDNGDLRVRIMSDFLANQYIDVAGTTDVADGKMHFIGATYDGSSTAAGVTLYVDGVPERSVALSDSLAGSSASNGSMIIGNQLNGWEDQFQLRGEMFNFTLSDVVADASFFQQGSSVAQTYDNHTQVAFNLGAGSGQTVTDLSGHSNNGTLSDAMMWTTA